MEDNSILLKEVFGESSDSEDDDDEQPCPRHFGDYSIHECRRSQSLLLEKPSWERVTGINGLCLCRDFLSADRQSSLLSAIENEGWFTEASHNQAMRFGDLPPWAIELSNSIREAMHFSDVVYGLVDIRTYDADKDDYLLPSDLLWREPLFNQLIVNVYQPGEGICAHVDLMRFEDGIAIVSLESSCVMHFTRDERDNCNIAEGKDNPPKTKIPVYLTPGSLVLMWGEARYLWKHEINRRPGFQIWEGKEIHQEKRTSITLRRLCKSE
ncbi:uncharacterized protein LOC131155408 [Malania oleifera]|uniref:uncharacterized protein LOC131155408 n=1 Tax=Malania oleifera TaxID=397392 RepID=UPI0025AE7C07|nr:uncharacterized protein LOC131155408 [Malania oleifera]